MRAWVVNPGFFGGNPGNPAYQPVLIGGAMVNLEDRTRPDATAVVELDRTWDIPLDLTGHECLMASVSCPLDPWSGVLDANHDRHVGQRNLTILAGAADLKPLLLTLGQLVTKNGTLEITHGRGAAIPLVRAALGRTKTEFGTAARMRAPAAKAMRHGVAVGTGHHLLTMYLTDRGWLVADSARVWAAGVEFGIVARGRAPRQHPFATPLGTRRVIEKIGLERAELFGVVVDADPADALLKGMRALWGLREFSAAGLASTLAESPAAHLLRFAHHDPEFREDGGYSLLVVGG